MPRKTIPVADLWTVPESFGQHEADWPDAEQWYPKLSATAAEPLVLQAFAEAARPGLAEIPVRGEIPVRMVSALAMDVEARAMLLPRLDSARSLEQHPDIDGAVTVIAILLGGLAGIGPTAGLPDLADELLGLQLGSDLPCAPGAVGVVSIDHDRRFVNGRLEACHVL